MAATRDLVVYGGTPAGIGAAVAVARSGLRVLLLEPLDQIGGMLSGGLGRTDLGRPETVGGLFREFMDCTTPDNVDVAVLQARLEAQGQVIRAPAS